MILATELVGVVYFIFSSTTVHVQHIRMLFIFNFSTLEMKSISRNYQKTKLNIFFYLYIYIYSCSNKNRSLKCDFRKKKHYKAIHLTKFPKNYTFYNRCFYFRFSFHLSSAIMKIKVTFKWCWCTTFYFIINSEND